MSNAKYARQLAVTGGGDSGLPLTVFYVGIDGQLYYTSQQDSTPGDWGPARQLPTNKMNVDTLAAASNLDGTLEVVYTVTDQQNPFVLYYNKQTARGGTWVGERPLGTSTDRARRIVLPRNKNGTLEAIYIGIDNLIYHNVQESPGGSWSGAFRLGATDNYALALDARQDENQPPVNGILELFYLSAPNHFIPNQIWHMQQNSPGGNWSSASLLFDPDPGHLFIAMVVATNKFGGLEVFYIGTDGVIYHNWQWAPGEPWTDLSVFDTLQTLAKVLAVPQNAREGGLFYTTLYDEIWYNWAVPEGWSGGKPLGSPPPRAKALAVAQNQGGLLDVIYIGTDDVLYHILQQGQGQDSWNAPARL